MSKNTARNDITNDELKSKQNSKEYEEHHEKIDWSDKELIEYTFEKNVDGFTKTWRLNFPTPDCAIAHAKYNKADRVLCGCVVLGEIVSDGIVKYFKEY